MHHGALEKLGKLAARERKRIEADLEVYARLQDRTGSAGVLPVPDFQDGVDHLLGLIDLAGYLTAPPEGARASAPAGTG